VEDEGSSRTVVRKAWPRAARFGARRVTRVSAVAERVPSHDTASIQAAMNFLRTRAPTLARAVARHSAERRLHLPSGSWVPPSLRSEWAEPSANGLVPIVIEQTVCAGLFRMFAAAV